MKEESVLNKCNMHKSNIKWIKDSSISPKTIKLLEENMVQTPPKDPLLTLLYLGSAIQHIIFCGKS